MNLDEAIKVARSAPDGVPTAKYIGTIEKAKKAYHLYKDTDGKIWYETDFDREMRKVKRRKWKR